MSTLKIIGINYKDNFHKTEKLLSEKENPYSEVIKDPTAVIGIEWDVHKLPQAFIVNSKGFITYRLRGPITEKNYREFCLNIKESEDITLIKPAPVFKGKTLRENKTFISTEEWGNQTTLVNFFATWCAPCIEELVFLKKLMDQNESHNGF